MLNAAVDSTLLPPLSRYATHAENVRAINNTGQRDWPVPELIGDSLPKVLPFDFDLLPDTLRPWARDICERLQCAPDYVAVTIMAGLGSVIGRKVAIRPQQHTDWTETPNQWALLVGRPGVLKSPAMEQALSPIKRLAAKAADDHKGNLETYKLEVRAEKLKAEAADKRARERLKNNPNANVSDDLKFEEAEEPLMRRYIANDTSAASLGELLRQNPNGLLVHRDEMVSLLRGLDREDNSEARGFYLTGWNGNSAYTFDRIGRGLHLHIPAVCLSLLGSTQPARIADYLRAAVRGGSGDDGLIQRFGLLVWPDTEGLWKDIDREPSGNARREANVVFEALDRLDPMNLGAEVDQYASIPFYRFSPDALEEFKVWRSDLETRLQLGDLHPALESHLAKYRKLVPGLALILHIANAQQGAVGRKATMQALGWAEYLESHAQRAYASVTAPETSAAKAIIKKLRSGELESKFSARDIYRKGWAMLSDRQQVRDGLLLLVDHGWLTSSPQDTEGRTGTVYEANPKGLL